MAEERKDREPWSPRIDKQPPFTNSADYERSLGDSSDPPDITDEGDEQDEKGGSPLIPNTLKPGHKQP